MEKKELSDKIWEHLDHYNIPNIKKVTIYGISDIYNASKYDITYSTANNREELSQILNLTESQVIFCNSKLINCISINKNIIFVDNPRLEFIKVYNLFFNEEELKKIDKTAKIHHKSIIGEGTSIGPYSIIGENVTIGNNVVIESGVNIYKNTTIKRNTIISSGCKIGQTALAYEKNEDGHYDHYPQRGGVIIERDVFVGANTVIMRGTFQNTVIKSGTKIGALTTIGHNVIVGHDCMIINMSCLQGSAIIGNNVWIAANCTLKNGVKVGENSLIGMGSIVLRDISEGVIAYGNPAKEVRENK